MKSKRKDCRCPAAFRSSRRQDHATNQLPITIRMGQRVQWWDDLSQTMTVIGCAMWETARRLIDDDEWKVKIEHRYPRCHDELAYLLLRSNQESLIWLPRQSLKPIRELEYPTVVWNESRRTYDSTKNYRIEIPTSDGAPIKIGTKVVTKRIGSPLVESLAGMIWRESGLAAHYAEQYGEYWDMSDPDWRSSDLCLLTSSCSSAIECTSNNDRSSLVEEDADHVNIFVHPASDLEVF